MRFFELFALLLDLSFQFLNGHTFDKPTKLFNPVIPSGAPQNFFFFAAQRRAVEGPRECILGLCSLKEFLLECGSHTLRVRAAIDLLRDAGFHPLVSTLPELLQSQSEFAGQKAAS